MTGQRQFRQAERLFQERNAHAADLYEELILDRDYGALALFRLGQIYNQQGQVQQAYECHQQALMHDPFLARKLLSPEHPNFNYRYSPPDVVSARHCPLCGCEGKRFAVYNVIGDRGFVEGFDPIKIWDVCSQCGHYFAENRPRQLSAVLAQHEPQHYQQPKPEVFPLLGDILSLLRHYANGKRYLEVGVGAGEMIAVAREIGFEVTGVDIRPGYAQKVREHFGIPIRTGDILQIEFAEKFSVITLGDVLEHVIEPRQLLQKLARIMEDHGVLWISTPNVDSAYATLLQHDNPMWQTCQHLHYFSRSSLTALLQELQMEIVHYAVSKRYKGSMEIICRKK